MPSRPASSVPEPSQKQKVGLRYLIASINDSPERTLPARTRTRSANAPPGTLSPISATAMNTRTTVTGTENRPEEIQSRENDGNGQFDGNGEASTPRAITNGDAHTIRQVASSGEVLESISTSPTQTDRLAVPKASPFPVTPTVRNISAEFGPLRSYTNFSIAEDSTASNGTDSPQQQWSSAVGKANLGKSGRVIEKLMAENDMLKRDLKIAKFAVEDSKQDLKMAEGKMEALSGEYEARLHDAAITKALLKKRDRQLADLKGQIDGERQRAKAAEDSERNWRAQLEKTETETKKTVEEVTAYALLMEGRSNTLSEHWKEQREMVDGSVSKLKVEISTLLKEREDENRRICLLEELFESKTHALTDLERQKNAIQSAFEAYKSEQEAQLLEIKIRSAEQQKSNEDLNQQTQRALGELRWALAVQRDVREAV